MKSIYQVYSRLKGTEEWLEDHLPFSTKESAEEYIRTQWHNTHEYTIIEDVVFESAAEELEYHDALDAVGGDWAG